MRRLSIVLIAVTIIGACSILHYCSRDGLVDELLLVLYEEDTQYSQGYGERGYDAIENGDDVDRVYALLGDPIEVWEYQGKGAQLVKVLSYSISPTEKNFRRRDIHTVGGKVVDKVSGLTID